ncbi:hypothetical protein LCGC14_3028450 [marine sediment metagenome]|uniref:Uncharacterized protein n=1 Tax=marine sediment metagenome TaxID=412755 RepID=A0A0F8WTI6_9ZZZZ
MIIYPLSKSEARIVCWARPFVCCVLLAFVACVICDLADWLEGLIPLVWFGLDA